MAHEFLEFLTSNLDAYYPFKEDTSLEDDGGSTALKPSLFLDFLAVGALPASRYFIGSITPRLVPGFTELTFEIVDQTSFVVATFARNVDPALVRTVDSVTGLDNGRDIPMKWVWGPGLLLLATQNAPLVYTALQAEFEPSTIVPHPLGVLSLSLLEPNAPCPIDPLDVPTGLKLEGDIKFEEGNNLRIVQDLRDNSFVFTAARGLGAGVVLDCPEIVPLDPIPIVRVNGIDTQTDPSKGYTGNLRVLGDECLRVIPYPEQHMFALYNMCRECCECEDLDQLIEKLVEVEQLFGIINVLPDTVRMLDEVRVVMNEIGPIVVNDTMRMRDTATPTHLHSTADLVRMTDSVHFSMVAVRQYDTMRMTDSATVVLWRITVSDIMRMTDVATNDWRSPVDIMRMRDRGSVIHCPAPGFGPATVEYF